MLQERWLWPYCNAPQTTLSKTLRRSRCRSGFWSQTVRLELSCEAFGSCSLDSLDSLDSKLNCLNSVSTLSQLCLNCSTPIWHRFDTDLTLQQTLKLCQMCHWSSDDAIWGVVVFVSTWQVAEFQLRPFSWLRQTRSCGYSASVQMLQDGCVQFCFDLPMKPLQIIAVTKPTSLNSHESTWIGRLNLIAARGELLQNHWVILHTVHTFHPVENTVLSLLLALKLDVFARCSPWYHLSPKGQWQQWEWQWHLDPQEPPDCKIVKLFALIHDRPRIFMTGHQASPNFV